MLRPDVPLHDITANPDKYLPKNTTVKTYILCRLGNDSMIAADALRKFEQKNGGNNMTIKDVIGGLRAWTRTVDPGFPEYWSWDCVGRSSSPSWSVWIYPLDFTERCAVNCITTSLEIFYLNIQRQLSFGGVNAPSSVSDTRRQTSHSYSMLFY